MRGVTFPGRDPTRDAPLTESLPLGSCKLVPDIHVRDCLRLAPWQWQCTYMRSIYTILIDTYRGEHVGRPITTVAKTVAMLVPSRNMRHDVDPNAWYVNREPSGTGGSCN